MELFSNIMHRVTSRILVCKELCRKPEYIKASLDFSNSVFMNGVILSTIPLGPFRKFISWLGSFNHRRHLNKAMKLLIPVIEERLRDLEQSPDGPKPVDALQWTIEQSSSDKKERTPTRLAHQVLQNLWAGSGAPGGMLTQMIYQVLWCPEYLEPMREEIRASVAEHGWTDKMLNNIPKVDSFLRETNRLYPNGVSESLSRSNNQSVNTNRSVTAARTVMDQPYQFHDGFTLPVGARIAFPSRAIMCDSDNFENPYEFDGFRFARLGKVAKSPSSATEVGAGEQLYNSATVTKTNLP